MIRLAEVAKANTIRWRGGKEWSVRNPLVAGGEEQTKAVHHVLGSRDLIISFKDRLERGKPNQ
jgi:hypothetical protein